jgi:hypothetical protein
MHFCAEEYIAIEDVGYYEDTLSEYLDTSTPIEYKWPKFYGLCGMSI